VRLPLDELWTPTIALELRKRGFDVIAISEPAHAGRYAGTKKGSIR
jgi:alpha-beta hydrolase superfamily lysophospholipase